MRRLLTPPLLFAAFLLVLLEETVWRWATALGRLIARIPVFGAVERLVVALPPPAVFTLFIIPMALLLPVKLAALWLIGTGHAVLGLGVILLAKMLGTALSARLYAIAEPKLMQVAAFARLHGWVTRLLRRAHEFLEASAAYRRARDAMHQAKAALQGLALRARAAWAARGRGALSRRFAAARRRLAR